MTTTEQLRDKINNLVEDEFSSFLILSNPEFVNTILGLEKNLELCPQNSSHI